jgi:hypothetical protein
VTHDYSKPLFVVRYVLPMLLTTAGLATIVANPHGTTVEGGMGLVGAGLAAFLFSALTRLSMADDKLRGQEADARDFFDEHLYWPDEDPSAADRRRRRSKQRG